MLGWECPATAAGGEHGPVFEGEADHLADTGVAVGVLAGPVHHLGGFDLVVAGGAPSAEETGVSKASYSLFKMGYQYLRLGGLGWLPLLLQGELRSCSETLGLGAAGRDCSDLSRSMSSDKGRCFLVVAKRRALRTDTLGDGFYPQADHFDPDAHQRSEEVELEGDEGHFEDERDEALDGE